MCTSGTSRALCRPNEPGEEHPRIGDLRAGTEVKCVLHHEWKKGERTRYPPISIGGVGEVDAPSGPSAVARTNVSFGRVSRLGTILISRCYL